MWINTQIVNSIITISKSNKYTWHSLSENSSYIYLFALVKQIQQYFIGTFIHANCVKQTLVASNVASVGHVLLIRSSLACGCL